MSNIKKRFRYLNFQFYPYLEKVIKRLPNKVRDVLLDNHNFQILSIGKTVRGQYYPFENSITHLVVLNEEILDEPEFQIIHTITHEIAHWIAGKGKTDLWEKEAENLLVKWGFNKESVAVEYHRSIYESEGYEIGYEWARKHEEDLSSFEEYYDEWNQGQLSSTSLDRLFYEANVMSILDEMGCIEHEKKPEDINEESIIHDDGSLDKGIVWGIMNLIKEKNQKTKLEYQDIDTDKADFF